MKQNVLFSLAFLAAGFSAFADTVLWYRFDERQIGEVALESDVLTNLVDSSICGASAYSIDTGTTLGADPAFMPVFASPLARERIYDPVTGVAYENRASISFRTVGTADALAGGAVVIPDHPSQRLSDYTVECFVCTTGGVYNLLAPIVGKPKSGAFTGESWQIAIANNGCMFMRYNGNNTNPNGYDSKHAINDGRWHHVALTCSYDREADISTYRLYVDYELDMEKQNARVTGYGSSGDNAIYIGGYKNAGRKFNGMIDEFRLSDRALEPGEFLRRETPTFVDADTLVWMSFDGAHGASVPHGENSAGGPYTEMTTFGEVPAPAFSAEVPAPHVRAGVSAFPVQPNTGSLFLQTNGVFNAGGAVVLDKYPYTATNLTAELFFRTAGSVTPGNSQTLLKINSTPFLQLTLDNAQPGTMIMVYGQKITGVNVWTRAGNFGSGLDDGNWHHVAAVYDADGRTLSLYIDYTLVKRIAEVVLSEVETIAGVGATENGSKQQFHGWIDSVRFTRRALQPVEFLNATKGVCDIGDETRFLASFDGDYQAFSKMSSFVLGTGYSAGYDNCVAPVFTDDVYSPFILRDDYARDQREANAKTNAAALFMSGSRTFYRDVPGMDGADQTAELFCRICSVAPMAGLLRVNNSRTDESADPVWAIYVNEVGVLSVRCSMIVDGVASGEHYWNSYYKADTLCDGKWHHLAVTFKRVDGGAATRISLYIDGELIAQSDKAGTLRHIEGNSVALGYSVRETNNLVWTVDEVRISDGVLPPERFQHHYRPPTGLTVIVK